MLSFEKEMNTERGEAYPNVYYEEKAGKTLGNIAAPFGRLQRSILSPLMQLEGSWSRPKEF